MGDANQNYGNTVDNILSKLTDLNEELNKEIDANLGYIDAMFLKINELKEEGSEGKKQAEVKLSDLQRQLETLKQSSDQTTKEKEDLTQQLAKLKDINTQVGMLEKTVSTLIKNNKKTNELLNETQAGGFQYNKKHSKHKRQFRLFSRSNSKTTSKKSKKRRRRPGKSVKKGGMKTRRRRRNKKSKKSKKRRK